MQGLLCIQQHFSWLQLCSVICPVCGHQQWMLQQWLLLPTFKHISLMWLDAQGTIFTAECYGHAWTMHAFVCVHPITKILLSTYYHECIFFCMRYWSIAFNLFWVRSSFMRGCQWSWTWLKSLERNLHNYYLLKTNFKLPAFSFSWMWRMNFFTKSLGFCCLFYLLDFTPKSWWSPSVLQPALTC